MHVLRCNVRAQSCNLHSVSSRKDKVNPCTVDDSVELGPISFAALAVLTSGALMSLSFVGMGFGMSVGGSPRKHPAALDFRGAGRGRTTRLHARLLLERSEGA